MSYLAQMFFAACLAAAGYFIYKRFNRIRQNILLGRDEDRSDQPEKRRENMLLIAFGQKKMFDKPLIGFMHLIIYLGFIIINAEVLEIVLDGLLGTHRLFAPYLGSLYTMLINFFEFLAVGVLLVCVAFLVRRNVMHIKRFQMAELTKWPRTDANIILFTEIALMTAFLTMNAADSVLQDKGSAHYLQVGSFAFSSFLKPIFASWSETSLIAYERIAWWFHILGILGFAVYVTYSKHLHIFLAFPNTYFARLNANGEISNMPVVTREVKLMLNLPVEEAAENAEAGRFGAKDINDLSWKNLLDAYTCTECGRCSSVCPANLTGKKLSPRKIMMDTRDRLEEVGNSLEKGGVGLADGKTLYGDYITKEELWACTTCNACVDACPVNINPLDIIVELRRYMAMEESNSPASWNAMFSNIENNMAPWKFSPTDRANWIDKANQ
jgi:heterodisulfide reductase subunit C